MRAQYTRLQFVRLCDCGCGKPTLIALDTDRRYGIAKGQPYRFIRGHNGRGIRITRPTSIALTGLGPGGKHTATHTYDLDGYTSCYVPDHPYASRTGHVLLHRLVVERHLDRYLLPEEVVHHWDLNRGNNNIDNLQLFANDAEHHRVAHGKNGRWSTQYDACVECGTTECAHDSHGMCRSCRSRWRYRNNDTYRRQQIARSTRNNTRRANQS